MEPSCSQVALHHGWPDPTIRRSDTQRHSAGPSIETPAKSWQSSPESLHNGATTRPTSAAELTGQQGTRDEPTPPAARRPTIAIETISSLTPFPGSAEESVRHSKPFHENVSFHPARGIVGMFMPFICQSEPSGARTQSVERKRTCHCFGVLGEAVRVGSQPLPRHCLSQSGQAVARPTWREAKSMATPPSDRPASSGQESSLSNLCCVNIPRSSHGRQTVGFPSHFAIGPRSGERVEFLVVKLLVFWNPRPGFARTSSGWSGFSGRSVWCVSLW